MLQIVLVVHFLNVIWRCHSALEFAGELFLQPQWRPALQLTCLPSFFSSLGPQHSPGDPKDCGEKNFEALFRGLAMGSHGLNAQCCSGMLTSKSGRIL